MSTTVGGFDGATEFDLPVECTYDFEVAAPSTCTRSVPARYRSSSSSRAPSSPRAATGFAAAPLSWTSEASYRLPFAVWRSTMDAYYPGSAFIRVRRGTLDDLQRFKAHQGLPTWDQAFAQLLKEAQEEGP